MRRVGIVSVAVAVLVAAGQGAAQVAPQPGKGDPRIQWVDYDAEQVVQLRIAVNYQALIEFGPGERIENVALGNSTAWQAAPNQRGDRLFIKPVQDGVPTNMVVATDAHTYNFDLTSAGYPDGNLPYTVRFRYAADSPHSEATPVLQALYVLRGSKALHPTSISDDGRSTYINWPAQAPMPAVFVAGRSGSEALVNGAVQTDGRFVIDGVAQRLVFRLGKLTAYAERRPIAERKR
jgi:type IV secretion system protein VirB9